MPFTDRFNNAYVGEKLVLTFDYSDELAPSETLAGTPAVEVDVMAGTDAAPDQLLNGSPQIVGAAVLLPVDPSVAAVDYRIKVTVDTSNPLKRLACVGHLYIEAEPA